MCSYNLSALGKGHCHLSPFYEASAAPAVSSEAAFPDRDWRCLSQSGSPPMNETTANRVPACVCHEKDEVSATSTRATMSDSGDAVLFFRGIQCGKRASRKTVTRFTDRENLCVSIVRKSRRQRIRT